ncbi:unnamed protein product [Cylicocyclus nassatus]|uniref:Uncharacterized protein n=1 Tax=Cylicocyclus nassatus TaxID=53992 RepID=A0AA36H7J9_CYLNA|nr:unnamed protein product [Cylicocyclus nassatus]
MGAKRSVNCGLLILTAIVVLAVIVAVVVIVMKKHKKEGTSTEATKCTTAATTIMRSTAEVTENIRCLMVGDLLNFNDNTTAYDKEKDFMSELAYGLYRKTQVSKLGLWVYGYTTSFTNLNESLKNMRGSPLDFLWDLYALNYKQVEKPTSTFEAIEQLNNLIDLENRSNCLIFLSASTNTSGLPLLSPNSSLSSIEKIVAIGYNDVHLNKIVVPPQGTALAIPYSYTDEDLEKILNMFPASITTTSPVKSTAKLLNATTPETKTSTTPSATTLVSNRTTVSTSNNTEIPTTKVPFLSFSNGLGYVFLLLLWTIAQRFGLVASDGHNRPRKGEVHCLFVGDLMHFGDDKDEYEREKHFIFETSKELFDTTRNATAAMWVFGYTDGPRGLKDILANMRTNFKDFERDLNERMIHKNVKVFGINEAIGNLNQASDKNRNANCVVFFTALTVTSGVKTLDPKGNNDFKRVVVVSLEGVNLDKLVVPPRGEAVSITSDYTKEDVAKVIKAVLSFF